MPQQLYDKLLHKYTKHTNMEKPYSKYITGNIFPEQITKLLNNIVTLRYRNHYISDVNMFKNINIIGRPSDDTPTFKPSTDGPEIFDYDPKNIQTNEFRIVRADAVEPYRMIAISTDYTIIIVSSTEKDDSNNYKFINDVSEYPLQFNEYIGLGVYDQYVAEPHELKAATLRVDNGEPCYAVLMEFLGSTGYVRFTLGDETFSKLYDYFDIDGSRDFDAKDSKEYSNPIDVNGAKADHSTIAQIQNVDGGYSDQWSGMYSQGTVMTDKEIVEFRKNIMEGVKIYGTM